MGPVVGAVDCGHDPILLDGFIGGVVSGGGVAIVAAPVSHEVGVAGTCAMVGARAAGRACIVALHLVDLIFNWKAMTVPAKPSLHMQSKHGLITRNDILYC